MYTERRDIPDTPKADRGKMMGLLRRMAGALVNLILMATIGAASFYLSTQYFTLKRSTTLTVLATAIEENRLEAYRPASGALDIYALAEDSPFISIPLAEKRTFLDRDGKVTSLSGLSIGIGDVRPVTVTILPDGTILRIKDAQGLLSAQGEVSWGADGELSVQGTPVCLRQAMFLASGQMKALGKEELPDHVSPGDVVKIMGFQDEAVVVELVHRGGTISVDANVPGARVYVDGELKAKSPCEIAVAPGDRTVAVKAAGYRNFETLVTVGSLQETRLNPVLEMVTGRLNVTSDPLGAFLSIDGVSKGNTPLTLDLAPGRYEIVLEMEGYRPKTSPVTVMGDVSQDVSFKLTKAPGQSGSAGGAIGRPEALKFAYSGTIMAKEGDRLYIGDSWVACDVSPAAKVSHQGMPYTLNQVRPGDVVTVQGRSASDLTQITVDSRLYRDASFEAFLVEGSILYGEAGRLHLRLPAGLTVVNTKDRKAEALEDVPSGSRVLFSLGLSGDIVWAEYLWRAETSVNGRVGLVSGASMFLMPRWEANSISMSTNVYLDDTRTSFFDIKQGDTVLAAGPSNSDIRFVRVEDRISYVDVRDCVVTAQPSKQGKVLFERKAIPSGKAYPIVIPPGTDVADLRARVTLSSDELQWGDRVKIYLDAGGKVVWAEATELCSERVTGRYLGEKDGVLYFTGCVPMIMRDDAVIQGLFGSDTLQTGAKVLAGGKNGHLLYLEVQENTRPGWAASGTVVSHAKNALSIWAGETTTLPFAKDTRFVDWASLEDGPLTGLFPGDRVSVLSDTTGTVYWVERTYTPPLKLEGTVTAVQGRVLTVGDNNSSATVSVDVAALVLRDGIRVDLETVQKGDSVKLSGDSVGSIDVVVSGR